jgi:predicted Na+-dependent transporter
MTVRNSVHPVGTLLGVLCFAAAIDIGASWLLGKPGFGSHARIVVALLPIPANLVLVAVIVRTIRQLDEFLRRVHLEAIAIAFLLTVLAASVYEDLQKAHVVGSLNVGTVWIFMALFYGIGYFIAARHYR